MGSTFTTQGINNEESEENEDVQISPSDEFCFVPAENRIANLLDEFDAVQELGRGSSCSVWLMRRKATDQWCAVKTMKRSHKSTALFQREANILLKLRHNNIIGLIGVNVDQVNYYIAEELCTGGALLDRVQREQLCEREAMEISYQILDAVKFLHHHDIVHRDIKLANIMIQNTKVVLIDFGLAKEIQESDEYDGFVGTPTYMAPEVTRRRTGAELKKGDVWAIGVAVYMMVTRWRPFYGPTVPDLLNDIRERKVTFPACMRTPGKATKFIVSLLTQNPAKRPSAAQAMEDEWFDLDDWGYSPRKE